MNTENFNQIKEILNKKIDEIKEELIIDIRDFNVDMDSFQISKWNKKIEKKMNLLKESKFFLYSLYHDDLFLKSSSD